MKLLQKSIGAKWIAVGAGILAACILLGYYLLPSKPNLPPQQAINLALKNTSLEKSYEYRIKMITLIDGQEQVASDVTGERQDQNRIHIRGRIFDSEVDFYQIESTTFTKDQLTGEWIKITDNQLNQQEIFMQELNPLAGFAYKELNAAAFTGTEQEESGKYWVYTASPIVDNPYMEILWKDFRHKYWVEPRSMRLHKAEITAASKNNPADKLNLIVEFRNYGGNITVDPPSAGNQAKTP